MTTGHALRFRENGEFRILHLTDIHKLHPNIANEPKYAYRAEEKSQSTLRCIRECVESENPDLVVFGGDNITGYLHGWTTEYVEWCLERITAPIREKGIPLAVVFGNHDAENEGECPALSRARQLKWFMRYENFIGSHNEAEMRGVGNCHIPIYAAHGDRVLWNIWCVDSNAASHQEPVVDETQIRWYEQTVAEEKRKYGRTIPAILFQHIPVRQVYDCIEECDRDQMSFEADGKFYHTRNGMLLGGELREKPCASPSRDQFEAWKRCGDIRAAFFGHDHTNTFHYEVSGISLYQTVICGYENYGDEHGGRLITLRGDGKTVAARTIIKDASAQRK